MDASPRVTSFNLKEGQPTTIEYNRPVKFKIVFTLGTYIEGIIPPNSGFTVCSRGDITQFSIIIDDDSVRKPGLLRPADEEADDDDGNPRASPEA